MGEYQVWVNKLRDTLPVEGDKGVSLQQIVDYCEILASSGIPVKLLSTDSYDGLLFEYGTFNEPAIIMAQHHHHIMPVVRTVGYYSHTRTPEWVDCPCRNCTDEDHYLCRRVKTGSGAPNAPCLSCAVAAIKLKNIMEPQTPDSREVFMKYIRIKDEILRKQPPDSYANNLEYHKKAKEIRGKSLFAMRGQLEIPF